MKKFILLGSLVATLTACGMDNTAAAHHDCNQLNYAKGTPQYQHCVVDMKNAEDLSDQNKANLK